MFRLFSNAALYACLAMFAVVGAATARATGDEITLSPHWKKGEVRRYEMSKIQRKSKDGKPASEVIVRTPIDLTVAEARDDGYVVNWTQDESRLDNPRLAENPTVRASLKLAKEFKLVLEIDEQATLGGIRNWEEVKAFCIKSADNAIAAQKAAGADPEKLKLVRAQALAQFETKEQIEENCTRDVKVLIMPLGHTMEVGKPLEYEDELPNPFGGDAFPAKGSLLLKSVDRNKNRAVVEWSQTFDPEKSRPILAETLRRFGEQLGTKAALQPEAIKNLSIEDKAKYTVELDTGWVRDLKHTRTTVMGDGKQETVLIFVPRFRP